MSTHKDPIAQAARLNLKDDLTPEQREQAIENRERSIEAATMNPRAGDVTREQNEDRNGDVWTEELLNATDPSSRYSIMNNLYEVFASIWGPLASLLTGNAEVGDRFARESWMKDKYSPEAGSPIIRAKPETQGLDGAQANLQKEFPQAAAGTHHNTDAAPTHGMSQKA